jgi:hypothetical protein
MPPEQSTTTFISTQTDLIPPERKAFPRFYSINSDLIHGGFSHQVVGVGSLLAGDFHA